MLEERKAKPGIETACVSHGNRREHCMRPNCEKSKVDSLGLQMKATGARSKLVFAGSAQEFEFSCCKWLRSTGGF